MPRTSLALTCLLLAAAGCAAGSRWVPATAATPGHCRPVRPCDGQDHACVVERRNESMRCGLDRARQEVSERGEVQVFDDMSLLALSPDGQCSEAHHLLSDQMLALYPAVHARVEESLAAGQIDLATQRARLLLHVVPRTEAAIPWMNRLGDVITRAQTAHREQRERLAASLPGAALYHHRQLDSRDDQGAVALQLRHDVEQLSYHRHSYRLSVQAAGGCEEARDRLRPGLHQRPGAPDPPDAVEVEVNQCAPIELREPIQVHCVVGQTRRQVMVRGDVSPAPVDRRPAPAGPPGRTPPPADRVRPPLPVASSPPAPPPPLVPTWVEEPILRTATAWRLTSGYKIHASWRLNGVLQEHPIDILRRNQELVVPPGCELATSVALETTPRDRGQTWQSLVHDQLAGSVEQMVQQATPTRVSELREAARQAAGGGDLDRADHFYQLALAAASGAEAAGVTDEVEAWFARRYGARTRRDPRVATHFVTTPIGLVFEPHADRPFADPRERDCRD